MKPRLPLLLAAVAVTAFATSTHAGLETGGSSDVPVLRALPRVPVASAPRFGTSNSNCAGSACDTVWIGHGNAGPGGAFLGVTASGVWDFDTGIAGTDSTQGWRF